MTSGNSDKLRVFLVEDTVDLRDELVFGLSALGLEVTGFSEAAGLYRTLVGIPDDRDRSFRRIVTEDSDLS